MMNRSSLVIPCVLIFALLFCSLLLTSSSQAAGCSGNLFATNLTIPSSLPAAVVFADFNNDGKADLAVGNFLMNTVSVSLGDGSGGFGTPIANQITPSPMSIAVGDFNTDGKLDVAVAEWFNHQVAIALGNGDGTFSAPTRIDVGHGPKQVETGDFNGDNKVDFATVGFFQNTVSVFLGNGSGGFSEATGSPFAAGLAPESLSLGDFNSDNKLDVAVISDGRVRVMLGNGLGGLALPGPSITVGQAPIFIDKGDFNGDAKLDLAVANNSSSDVSILFGDGAGNFQVVDTIRVGPAPREILVADLDGSGKPDIVSSNSNANNINVLLNDGTGTLKPSKSFAVGNSPRALAATDLNGDGNRDLAVTNFDSGNVSVLMGKGGGDFNGPAIIPVFSNPAQSLAVGDFNSDGHQDLAAGANGRTSILLSNGAGGFNRVADVGFGTGAFVSTLDLDNNDKLDLLIVDGTFNNQLSSLLGLGDGTFAPRRFFPVGGEAPISIATGDFNRDGKPDAATSNYGSANLSIFLGDGLGGFAPPTHVSVFSQTPFVVSGDFNNDGKTDLAAIRNGDDTVAVLLGNGNGTFTAAQGSPFIAGPSPWAIAVSDFNGDGDADLAITNHSLINMTQTSVAILLGNGSGSFSAPTKYSVGHRSTSIAVADYNLDGKPDLATADADSNALSILPGNGDGTFGAASKVAFGLNPVFVVAADFNSDGRKDLATATAGGVVVLPNTCSSAPVAPPSLSIADVNVVEGDAGTANVEFTVTLSAASDVTVSVSYNTFGLTASAADFQQSSARLKFAPGVTTQTITVPVIGDEIDEFDETVGIKLSEELNATIVRGQAKATILDNDPPPTVSIGDVSIQEGDAGTKIANLAVNLSKASGKPITVQYATADNTASAGTDYVATGAQLTFQAGETQKVVAVQINGDTFFEADETFFINLTNPVDVTLADAQGVGTIANDDTLKLILDESGPSANQATAFESMLLVRDPFRVLSIAEWAELGSDRNTRVTIFSNLQLNPQEAVSIVTVNLLDSSNQSFDVPAHDVRPLLNTPFTQVTFRLPNNLSSGVVQVTIRVNGHTSNTGTVRILP